MENSKRISLKYRIATAFFAVLLPVVIFMGVYVSNTIAGLNKQVVESNQVTLNLFCTSLENEMAHAESFLVDTALTNVSFHALDNSMQKAEAYLKGYNVKSTFSYIINADSDISCLLLYSSQNDLYLSEFGALAVENTVDRSRLKRGIQDKVVKLLSSGPLDTEHWFAIKINGRQFWMRAVRYHSAYLVCLIDLNQLVSIKTSGYNLIGPIVLLYDDKVLAQGIKTDTGSVKWQSRDNKYYLTEGEEQYLVVQQPIGKLVVAYLLPYKDNLKSLDIFQRLLIILSIFLVLSIPITWLYLRRSFIRPIDELVKTMNRIKAGDLTAQPDTEFNSWEFAQVNETFNSMINEITKLKISTYEKQLAFERAELARLKMQIKPHFYLNCLKNIFALAETKRMKEIQNTILKLSNHLRYVFSNDSDTVLLEKELQLCQNYVELQNISQVVPIECKLNVDADLMNVPVPPVSLLTLVENSIKHGICQEHSLIINITIRKLILESENLVNITVWDNGNGFPEQKLPELNQKIIDLQNGAHIGLSNTIRRFNILFGDEFQFACTNKNGAKIDLFIPVANISEKEETNEFTDC